MILSKLINLDMEKQLLLIITHNYAWYGIILEMNLAFLVEFVNFV